MDSETKSDKSCEPSQKKKGPLFSLSWFAVCIAVITIGIAVVGLFTLPSKIPSHWNASGEIDGYMPKGFILLMFPAIQIISLVSYGFLAPIIPFLISAAEPKPKKRRPLINWFTAMMLFFLLMQAFIFISGAGVRINSGIVVMLGLAFTAFFSGIRGLKLTSPILCVGAFFPSRFIYFVYTAIPITLILEFFFHKHRGREKYTLESAGDLIYSDDLIEITDNSILFRWYYFPFGRRRVSLSEIDHIVAKEPSLLSGKWRIHGTRDFKTWFPCDWKRPKRDRIFIATLQGKQTKIGFSVEDSEKVQKILKNKELLAKDER